MKALARFLLLAMVAMAVPVHGALAVTVGQCRALEHAGAGSVSGSHEAAAHGAGKAASPDRHDHEEHARSASDSAADTGDSAASGSHCGPCSACCASAAITGPVPLQLVNEAFSRLDLGPDQQPIGIRLARLDRPPLAL